MANPTPILNNINAFDATKGTTISFNIIGGTDIVRSNIAYIYDLSTNDLICTHLYISTESIHELPPNTDPSIVYADGKSSADFVNNKNYYLQIQTFTNTAGTAGGSGMSVAKTFWCLFNPALSVNAIPAAISTTSYNVGATYTTNITDVTIPVTNIIQQYKFDLYTATGTLVQTSGNIIGSGEQEGTSTTYNITYNFSGLVVNNSYYVVVTTTSTEGMTVSAQSNTFTVSIDTPTVGGAIVNNNACDGYISVVSNLSDEYGGHVSGEMASFETDSVNNVSSLKVNMEPIQDLHGYDHPWVGGAGKNLFDFESWLDSCGATYTKNGDEYEITAIGTLFNQPFVFSDVDVEVTISGALLTNGTTTNVRIDLLDTNGASVGSVYSTQQFPTTRTASKMRFNWSTAGTFKVSKVQIEKGSTATSWTPYSNICPISGRDSVSASVVGKNLFDKTAVEVGYVNDNTGEVNPLTTYRCTDYIAVEPNATYYVKTEQNNGGWGAWYDANKNYISSAVGYFNTTLTAPSNARYMRLTCLTSTSGNIDTFAINYPSTDHDYHAYQGQSYHQDIEVTYTPTVQENEPYQFKRTGDVGGDRESIELVGGSVAWNQLIGNGNFEDVSWWNRSNATYTVSNNVATMRATARGGCIYRRFFDSVANNHVYFATASVKTSAGAGDIRFRLNGGYKDMDSVASNDWQTLQGLYKFTAVDNRYLQIMDLRTSDWDDVLLRDIMCIDLTAMFNPTIADYIYSLEQSQAGAGVAWFRQYFPKDYYPYDKGTLRSVEGVSAHETVGFNQWDEEWEVGSYNYSNGEKVVNVNTIRSKNLIPCLPSTDYYFKANLPINTFYVTYYDANKNFVSADISGMQNAVKTTPSNASYMAFWVGNASNPQTTYNHDICINLFDPTRNGEYEPYQKHTYPLDSSLTLRGIPKLDASNNLYYDGDTYESDGTVTRKYGIVDLGTLTWKKDTRGDNWSFYTDELMSLAKKASSWNSIPNIKCVKYITLSSTAFFVSFVDKTMNIKTNGQLFIADETYNDAPAFKTAMSGVYLVYELATPTTETAEPFTNPQVVDNRGTEAYVTTGIVPVGHDSEYLTRDIFSGTLDLVTGVLTVDRAMYTFDGTEAWMASSTPHRFSVNISQRLPYPTATPPMTTGAVQNAITSVFGQCVYKNEDGVGYLVQQSSGDLFVVNISTATTVADIKTITTGMQLCYELATPQTYQLTPHQIQTLVGQNNVWSDAGEVDVTFNLPITNLLVKRQDTSDTSGNWLTLYSQPITQASDMDFTYIDFLNQHGKTYRYALVPLLTQQQGGIDVEIEGGYTVSDDVLSVFDGVFIANNNGSQKLKASTEYGDLETNQDVGVLTTIGGKYPFVVSNSNLNYHSGSISALIVPSDFYTSGDLDRLSIVERREAIEQFLTDKTAKILKDWNGNIWLITFVENVEVSFVDDYGMGLGTLSAKWVEIGDVNDQTDLKQTGLI